MDSVVGRCRLELLGGVGFLALVTACGDGQLDAFAASGDARAEPPSEEVHREYLLDDLEDGDAMLSPHGYDGWWYVFNDTTSAQYFGVVRHDAERSESNFAAWTRGANFIDWGAGLGVDLAGDGPGFDSTGYVGFTFWTRIGSETESAAAVHVMDESGRQYAKDIRLSPHWTKQVVYFDELEWVEWEAPGPLDRSRLGHLQIFWFSPRPFEAWVDDLAVIVAE